MKNVSMSDDPMYRLLREGKVKEFNKLRAAGNDCALAGTDLRGTDLRNIDARGLDLRDCYLRQADLRGVDLRDTLLEGASIAGAKISGTYFPKGLSPQEIKLSLQQGTRLRYG